MNESTIRQRLRSAIGESTYPPDLPSRVAARLGQPAENRRSGRIVLAVVAVVLAVALVATIVFGVHVFRPQFIPVGPPFNPGASSCPGYGQLMPLVPSPTRVVTPTTAWATGGLRSTDAGAHWRDVSPADLRSDAPTDFARKNMYPPAFSDFDLDGNRAWLARTYGSDSSCFDHATVFMTSDAGQTWKQSAPVQLGIKSGSNAVLQLDFVDPLHGWLWVTTGPMDFASALSTGTDGVLYGTSDGGLHWQSLSDKPLARLGIQASEGCPSPAGKITFASTTTGWITSACQTSPLRMLLTRDGGVTWAPRQVPATTLPGCPCFISRLVFFDSSHGVLSVYTNGAALVQGKFPALLTTSDAGLTWHALPATPSTGYSITLAFTDLNNWWDVVTPPGWSKGQITHDWLYKTTDGGQTWKLVQQDTPMGWPVQDIFFTDADHGWAVQSQGAAGTPPLGPGTEVLTTSDGGHTWKSVIAQIDPRS